MRVALFLGLMMAAAPAVAADQFDLLCTAKKANVRYRVDLNRGEWCSDECRSTYKIDAVTSADLTLENKPPKFRGDGVSLVRINRSTAEWQEIRTFSFGTTTVNNKGTCKPSEFSGFPKAKF